MLKLATIMYMVWGFPAYAEINVHMQERHEPTLIWGGAGWVCPLNYPNMLFL